MHYDYRDTQVTPFQHFEARVGAAHVFPGGGEWPLSDPQAQPECMSAPFMFEADATEEMRELAARVCAACPFRAECLGYAVRHQVSGTWGGQYVTQEWRWATRRRQREGRI